jgi:SCY1-like protein 2
VKNEVFPPIAATFSRTNSLAIKIRALECFVVLCGGLSDESNQASDDLSGITEQKPIKSSSSILDKYTVQEKIVPLLKAIKTKEPAVMIAALNVFRQVGKIADTEFIAHDVLPILWAFSLGPLLNLKQFESFMTLIKFLSTKVEREHTKKLQEISARDENGDSRANSGNVGGNQQAASDVGGVKNDFERLVLGKNGTSHRETDNLWDSWNTASPENTQPPQQHMPPAFSWSSNPGEQNRSSNILRISSAVSSHSTRSITPDLSSLGASSKQPTPMNQMFPALQPSTSSWSQPNAATPSLGMRSTASGTSTFSSPQQTIVPNYNSFSLPPPPPSVNPTIPQSSFNQQTPNIWGNNIQGAITGQPSQPKQGLDKYESLL